MNFNYNIEIKNMLDKIYENKIYSIAVKNNINHIDSTNLKEVTNIITSTKIYLGSDMDEFIINLIPKDKDGYYFRCSIAKHHNHSFPRLYDYSGNPVKNAIYGKFAIQLWEGHMNNFLIEDIQRKFNQSDFVKFVESNLENLADSIIDHVNKSNELKSIMIPFKNKSDLINVVKSMILRKELDSSWSQLLVDMDAIRDYMSTFAAAFHIYNEFDKLEDETEFCIDNFCKYNSDQLFDILVNDKNFEYYEGIGLKGLKDNI